MKLTKKDKIWRKCGLLSDFDILCEKLKIPEGLTEQALQEYRVSNLLKQDTEKHLKRWLIGKQARYYGH